MEQIKNCNVITYSVSPYIKSKIGRIHSYILHKLYEEQCKFHSICWHHDLSYYLPDDQGKYHYDIDNNRICEIFY